MAAIGAALFCLSAAPLAHANDVRAADKLFREGREALAKGKLSEACTLFTRSQALDPAAGTLMNLALCTEQLGKLTRSAIYWRGAMNQLSRSDPRRKACETHLKDVERRIATVRVSIAKGAPPGTMVRLNGVPIPDDHLGRDERVDPGRFRFTIEPPNGSLIRHAVDVKEGARVEVELPWNNGEPSRPEEASAPSWAYAVGGLGVVALGTGIAFAIDAAAAKSGLDEFCLSSEPVCTGGADRESLEGRKERGAPLAMVLSASGLVAISVAAYAITTSSKPSAPSVSGWIAPSSAGASVSGRF